MKKSSCNLHTLEKISHRKKKSPTLTSLFFLLLFLFDSPHSSFPIPIFGGVSPTSTSLHLSGTPPKIFRPCGAKGKRKKREEREEEKRTLIPIISVDRAVGPWWSLRRDFGLRSHIYNFPFLIYYPSTLIA